MTEPASAFWVVQPGRGEIREQRLRTPETGEVLVRTLWSGVSKGTETLVFEGRVPAELRDTMRAPHQQGDFPAPVSYGYLAVGVVEEGPGALLGKTVFCLHPHQTRFVVPAAAVTVVPEDVPARRAVLAGTVETAVNALWDAPPLLGDRIAVVGAGMVGCSVARLAAAVPGTTVTLIDVDPARAEVAAALGVDFAAPDDAPAGCDLVVHTSATEAGLRTCLDVVADEGDLLELSWYGDREVSLPLGGRFHSGRLSVRASQVGRIAPARRDRRTFSGRLGLALRLLQDPAYDALLTGTSPFSELPRVLADLSSGRLSALCHTIDYQEDRS